MFYRDVLIESRERNAFMSKELQIRNSTVDFLVFTRDAGEDGIEVRVQNGDVWLTQKAISQLFDVDRSVVTKHLSNIFKEGELDENSTCANFAQTEFSSNSPSLKILLRCFVTTLLSTSKSCEIAFCVSHISPF